MKQAYNKKIPFVEMVVNLQKQGYKVIINNVYGTTFTECYLVYQDIGWDKLKVVIVTNAGEITGLQG